MKQIRTIAVLLAGLSLAAWGQGPTVPRVVNDGDVVQLPGNVPPQAQAQFDRGPSDFSLPMGRMILVLGLRPGMQAELDAFLAEQHNPNSPLYQQWLTPEQFGQRFGISDDDLSLIQQWLISHGFAIDEVARSRGWINFSGTVGQVEQAFHTQIHDFNVNGESHHANTVSPSIPRGLADIVRGIVSLHDFRKSGMHTQPQLTASNGAHFLAPADFATIYNVNALYGAGINGSGQTIAIVGRTDIQLSDVQAFRTFFGLPANDPVFVHNGTPPGIVSTGEETEADLDVEWSGAVAPHATVKFVISASTGGTDGVDLSAQYIVNNNLAPVMSTSFGLCEQVLGSTENSFYNSLWSQAASQGITAFISSGDNGAAGCDTPSSTKAKSGLAVNGLCSTPFSVCVGGTQFNDTANPGLYWSSTNNSTTKQSVLGVIPEIAWNESGAVSGGSGLWASSGGVSTLYAKPSWQVAPGVPADGMRDVPDVSLSAASHDGYAVCQADVGGTCASGSFLGVGGTSASSPSFAGLMALVVQKTGFRQGNANTIFYPMANAQYGSSGTAVFRDITSGSNLVPNFPSGTIGYNTTTAYDRVTGLGSVDAAAMVNNWGGATAPDFGVSASPTDVTIQAGASGPSTITTTVIGGFNAAIALSASGQPAGVTVGFSPASISVPGSGTSTMTITVGAGAALGTTAITVTATGGAITHTTTVNLTVGKALAAVSVTPNSGSGLTQTFSFQFSDANGYNAITEIQTIINGSLTYTGGCVTWFSRATNAVALLNDAGTSWGTSVVIGTNTTLQNSQCSLNVGASSVSGSGNTFTENLAITFAAGFTGTKNIYASVAASGGLDSGWQTLGTWTPAALIATPPAAVSVTPSSGSGLTQTFSFQFSDVNGYSTITETQTIINGSLTYAGCVTWFNRATNAVALLNDAGTSWGTSVVIGTNTTLQNSQCSLNVGASSVSGSGNTLTENLAITFAAGFTGTKNVYAYVAAAGGLDSGWQTLGTWTPAALIATPPAAVSVTPSSGSGLTQTFSFQFSDVNGYGTITETQTIINGSLTYAGCVTWFNRATNAVALLNDAGTSWGTSVVIGTNTTLQNSQCSLNVGASSVSGSSNTLTENLAITFAAGFNGTKNVYAYVAASGGLDSGWHTLGTWVVP